ncbi:MAG: acetyl-CoA carboxylase biotin carboxyl carrier protein subunit [Akkermansia sp.]|nr:acetyl-CoA carboxylase biotin carboxyl carrier protein subunit [Akkermansia sp.]
MKQLRITVAGQTFDVTVETVGGSLSAAPAPAPVAAPAPAAGAGTPVPSPLAGKVVSLDVTPGTAVKEGDQIMTLEAMKMNTVITAPADGTVTSFAVAPGDTVAENQPLAYLG